MVFLRTSISAPRARLVAWLIGALGALLAITPAVAQTAAPALAAPDAATLRSIERQVIGIRGLAPLAEPNLTVLDGPALSQYLRDEFDSEYLPNEREADQTLWTMLGLIRPSDDVVGAQMALLQAQVLGIYDTDTKRLFVVNDGSGFGPAQRQTYAHEFSHALQDQHFDLNAIAPKHTENNDRSLAVHAMIEGDAVLLQNLWGASHLTANDQQELIREASASDNGLDLVPTVMRVELLFPYLDGVRFVIRAYVDAGRSFSGVDALFNRPPTSTAQVLHYDKYLARVEPVEVTLPDYAATNGDGWRRIGGGVLGELDTRVLLEQAETPHGQAADVAAGWAGDSWQLVEHDGRSALVLRSVWESEDGARAFFSEYARGLRMRFDAAMTDESTPQRQALTTPTLATDVRVSGNQVRVVLAPDRDTANVLMDETQS